MSEAAPQFRHDEAVWKPKHSPWLIALVVTLATFMEVLDTSVANVSLPHIAGNLSAGLDESTWVLTSYLVANAVILPLSGWFSDRIGRKRFYMSCVTLFTVSSLLCGLAPSLGWLVFFRILQGIGGGGLQPSEQAILADTFPPAKRGMAFAVYGMAVVAAPALGPTLGGWITDNFSWRWIFLINIPVGIVSLWLTYRMIADPPYLKERQQVRRRVDYIGFGLIVIGLACLQIVLDKGQREDWFETPYIVVLTWIFVVALVAAVFWELRTKDPVVDLRLFKQRNFAMATILLFILGVVLYGSTVLLPQFTQELMGYTAMLSGMVITPGAILIMFLMPISGFLVTHFDVRKVLAAGFLVLGLSMFYMCRFNLAVDFNTLMLARVYQSAALPFIFLPVNVAAYAFLARDKNNAASGLINLARNIGGSVGISMVTTILARREQFHQNVLSSHLTTGNATLRAGTHQLTGWLVHAGSSVWTAQQQAVGLIGGVVARQARLLAYIDNFFLMGLLVLLFVPLAFLMKRSRPGAVSLAH